MPQWPIRVKLIAGLSLVVGMMLTLMGGSIFGLHSFHASNLTLVDQLRELGASKDLLEEVVAARAAARRRRPRSGRRWSARSTDAQEALVAYHTELKKNTTRGNRADDGRDELGLAFVIDNDLTAILAELDPEAEVDAGAARARRSTCSRHPEVARRAGPPGGPRRADRPAQPPGHGPARQAPPRLLRDPARCRSGSTRRAG